MIKDSRGIFVTCALLATSVVGFAMLFGNAAKANVFYKVTATGVISSGSDFGAFGGTGGSDLTGGQFTVVETFDATAGTLTGPPLRQDLNPVPATAIVSVGGKSVSFTGFPSINEYLLASNVKTGGADQIDGTVKGNSQFSFNIYDYATDFVQSANLAQSSFFTIGPYYFNRAFFIGSDGSGFEASVSTVRLNDVPEPSLVGILSAALAGVGWFRRRKSA